MSVELRYLLSWMIVTDDVIPGMGCTHVYAHPTRESTVPSTLK